MEIFLKILMILGIIILSLIGLILLLLIIILAAPVKYSVSASANDGDIEARVLVKWLLFIKVPISFVEKKLDYAVRVFGFKVFPKKAKVSENTTGDSDAEGIKEADGTEVRPVSPEKVGSVAEKVAEPYLGEGVRINPEPAAKPVKNMSEADSDSQTEKESSTVKMTEQASVDSEKSPDESDTAEKLGFVSKIKKLWGKLVAAWEICGQEVEEVETFFKRRTTKFSIEALKKALFKILTHIRPRKFSGNVTFGFDDPATTGYVLAGASAFYGLYCESLELTPDFEKKVLNGNIEMAGRIVLGYLVYVALNIYIRKKFRMFIKNAVSLKNVTLENADKIKNQFVSDDSASAEI